MNPTERVYQHKETGEQFRFYVNPDNQCHKILISETTGERCPHFLIAAFTPIDFKLMDKKVVRLNVGEMLPIDMTNPPTHKKLFMQTRFSRY